MAGSLGSARNVVQVEHGNGTWPLFEVPTVSKVPMGGGNTHTVMMWVRGTFTSRNQEIFFAAASGSGNRDIVRVLTDGTVSYETIISFGGTSCRSTTSVSDGDWHHVAWRRVSDTLTDVVIDGVQEDTNTTNTSAQSPANSGEQHFLNRGLWNDYGFTGDVAGLSTWNRALSIAEIAVQSKFSTPTTYGCVGCWPLYSNIGLSTDSDELVAIVGGDFENNSAGSTTPTDGPGIAWSKPQPLYFDDFVETATASNTYLHLPYTYLKLY